MNLTDFTWLVTLPLWHPAFIAPDCLLLGRRLFKKEKTHVCIRHRVSKVLHTTSMRINCVWKPRDLGENYWVSS